MPLSNLSRRALCGAPLIFLSMVMVMGCRPSRGRVTAVPAAGETEPVGFTPVEVEVPGQVRVTLNEVDGDILKFMVFNLTDQTMLVLRDEVLLVTRYGAQRRERGGVSNMYELKPWGAHAVNVRFDISGMVPGEPLQVRFDRAVLVQGNRVSVPPLSFMASVD